jgi:hypothetical protein
VNIDAISEALGGSSVEFLENGRAAHNMIVGTDGNGVSDSDERNIVGHTVYDVHMEVYTAGTNMVVAGNYFGVGVDGVTRAPLSTNEVQNFMAVPGNASLRIGSNGDGVSDDLEGNLIVNGSGNRFTTASATVPIAYRRNRFVNCNYTSLANDSNLLPPVLDAITNNILTGTITPIFGGVYLGRSWIFTSSIPLPSRTRTPSHCARPSEPMAHVDESWSERHRSRSTSLRLASPTRTL